MWTMGKKTALGALLAFAALPVAASADPPAVGAPSIPPVFVGAPTNDNPAAGQFTVNFASTGAYEGVGIAPEPPLTRDVSPARERVQARSVVRQPNATERASVDRLMVKLQQQLRDGAATESASLGR